MPIETMQQFRHAFYIRWKTHPGYVWAFLMEDGENLCFHCAETNLRQLIRAMADYIKGNRPQSGLRVIDIINMSESESEEIEFCSHCNKVLKEKEEVK